jgi:hypothetical protein
LANALRELQTRCGQNRARIDNDGSLFQGFDGAISSEQDLFDCLGVGHAEPYKLGIFRGFLRSGSAVRAANDFARRPVPNLDFVTSFDQILGHRLTHDAESKKRNSHNYSFAVGKKSKTMATHDADFTDASRADFTDKSK